MKILYDYQAFSMQRVGGISRYFSILINSLPERGVETILPIIGSENMYVQGRGYLNGPRFKKLWKKNRRLSKIILPYFSYDLLHPTYYHNYVLKGKPKNRPMVITVHDMIHELFPSYFPDAKSVIEQKRRVCAVADRLVAISETTKRDMMDIWGIEEDRIDVVHHGLMWPSDLQSRRVELPFTGDYLLYVGDRGALYKNFEGFLAGVAPVLHKYGLHLVCTGYSFRQRDYELLRKYGVEDISYCVMVDESALLGLYEQASCFIFPSMYEGFGLPILEAFKARCPLLLSRSSCFPEIAGDAADYFDLGDPDALTVALEGILDDSFKREEMKRRGDERLLQYPISHMIDKTLMVYKKTLG